MSAARPAASALGAGAPPVPVLPRSPTREHELAAICGKEGVAIIRRVNAILAETPGLELSSTDSPVIFKISGNTDGIDMADLADRINRLIERPLRGYCYQREVDIRSMISLIQKLNGWSMHGYCDLREEDKTYKVSLRSECGFTTAEEARCKGLPISLVCTIFSADGATHKTQGGSDVRRRSSHRR